MGLRDVAGGRNMDVELPNKYCTNQKRKCGTRIATGKGGGRAGGRKEGWVIVKGQGSQTDQRGVKGVDLEVEKG